MWLTAPSDTCTKAVSALHCNWSQQGRFQARTRKMITPHGFQARREKRSVPVGSASSTGPRGAACAPRSLLEWRRFDDFVTGVIPHVLPDSLPEGSLSQLEVLFISRV
eukprot:TRINITY_DN13790_c0_g1_i1.p2 TRINITY_DN13790_c0_g1~~TRINITY_DN13790_c0_g1_i1.p2  ORF type:complete len:125 (-),score=8.01 TRINITY_DN13790_c0_g1_i1:57-380(-)